MSKSLDNNFGCSRCNDKEALGFDISMAFQPIINTASQTVFAHEALVRGTNAESAHEVFKNVNADNLYPFDQTCRTKAIELASKLNFDQKLSINFMPNAIYQPELCLRTTLAAAEKYNFPIDKIIFEITEGEKVDDLEHLKNIVTYYKSRGFLTAIDDFGAGYAGLTLISEIQTDIVKLDMALIRNINNHKSKQAIVKGILTVCKDLGSEVIAEGIETYEEWATLRDFGVELFQGYYFAKPQFEGVAQINFPK
ncbi:EAL domain-containing protein [Kangiella aquimarina]|uniref:EAL domain-containing protein n=1 Tax=Kangiella aquimarina TaxID=261965 RepID=A0ABZ0X2S1_9GAMM|nr:EAL domain-containing protein [Kangiella aquimarina]WQG84901.1 EAL domain-containing protein [Kangiella aquimarina]